uniref:Probable pectate lyase C n=1 Tax=Eutreptiella gymnastica TaxID=73025 RepID=A0A7S4GFF4_9EUGL
MPTKLPTIGNGSTSPKQAGSSGSQVSSPLPPLNGNNVVVSGGLSAIQIRALAKVFAQSDLDYDGKVDREELALLLDEMGYRASGADVDTIMRMLDVDRDGVITQEEFIGQTAILDLKGNAPKKEEITQARKMITPRQNSNMELDPEIAALFKSINIHEPSAYEACRLGAMTLKLLVELSYDPHDLNQWMNETGLSNESKRRLVRDLARQRNWQSYESKWVAILVSVGEHQNPNVCSPPGGVDDGDRLLDLLTNMGFAVHYLDCHTEEKSSRPTTSNILKHLRAVGGSLTTRGEEVTILIILIGNATRTLGGEFAFMPEDFDELEPIDEGMQLNSLMGLIPPSHRMICMADFAHIYDYNGKEYNLSGDRRSLISQGPKETYLYESPCLGGGTMWHGLTQALKAGNGDLLGFMKSYLNGYKALAHPQAGRSRARDWDDFKMFTGKLDIGSNPQHVTITAVIEGTDEASGSQQLFDSLHASYPSLKYTSFDHTARIGVLLKGDLAAQRGTTWQLATKQVDHFTGRPNTRYEIITARQPGHWFLVISLPLSYGRQAIQTESMEVVQKSRNSLVGASALRRKKKKKQAPKAPASPTTKKEKADSPAGSPGSPGSPWGSPTEDHHLQKSWDVVVQNILDKIQEHKEKGTKLSIGGLDAVTAGSLVELECDCTPEDAVSIDGKVKSGALVSEKILSVRIDPQRAKPNSGVISHPGFDMTASLLQAAWHFASVRLEKLVFHEHNVVGREHKIEHGCSDLNTLGKEFRGCRSGDWMEIKGKWSGSLGLDRNGVTLRGSGDCVITNEGYSGPAICLRGGSRLENLKVVSVNEHPAIVVEYGAPDIHNCEVISEGGPAIKCMPLTDPHIYKTVIKDCKGAPGMVLEGSVGKYEEVTISNCSSGVLITGQAMMNGPLMINCHIVDNIGVGVVSENKADARIQGCTIARNRTPGVIVENEATINIWKSFIIDNGSCGVKVAKYSGARIEDSEISGNVGNEILLENAQSLEVAITRNRFYKKRSHHKTAEVAIDLQNAKPLIQGNDFEGYRVCVLVRGSCHDTRVMLNRASPMDDPDAMLIRDASKYDGVAPQNVQFNEFYKGQTADPLHFTNRNMPASTYSLFDATRAGYCSIVRRLIADGANPNTEGKENPLLCAVRAEDEAMVKLLLNNKADPTIQDQIGWTPLHAAIHSHNMYLVRLLLEHGANVHIADNQGLTAAMIAIECDNNAGLSYLLKGASGQCIVDAAYSRRTAVQDKIWVNAHTGFGHTHLGLATRLSKIKTMELLLECKADLQLGSEKEQETPLHVAARYQCDDAMKWLLENGASPNVTSASGTTPLLLAIYRKSQGAVSMLLGRGANLGTADPQGITALHAAAMMGDGKILQVLLDKAHKMNVQTAAGRTPLHYAIIFQNYECAQLLLQKSVDPYIEDKSGGMPINYAADEGYTLLHDPQEEQLFQMCRSPDLHAQFEKVVKDKALVGTDAFTGISPFYQAVLFGNRRAAALLQEKGAEGNCSNKEGISALMWATHMGSDAMQKMLDMYGVKMKNRDKECTTRLAQAANHGSEAASVIKFVQGWTMEVSKTAPVGWSLLPAFPYPLENVMWFKSRMRDCIDSISYDKKTNINFMQGKAHRGEQPKEQGIMDFLDTVRAFSKPPIPEMDQLIWDARYKTINNVCAKINLPAHHQLVIHLWTQPRTLYTAVFTAMMNADSDQLAIWAPYLQALDNALMTIDKPYEGVCYMTANHLLEPVDAKGSCKMPSLVQPMQTNTQIFFPATTWATTSLPIAHDALEPELGTLFVVTSKTGREISAYSCHPNLHEVLFPVGCSFLVSKVYQAGSEEYSAFTQDYIKRCGPSNIPQVVVELEQL